MRAERDGFPELRHVRARVLNADKFSGIMVPLSYTY